MDCGAGSLRTIEKCHAENENWIAGRADLPVPGAEEWKVLGTSTPHFSLFGKKSSDWSHSPL